MSDVPNLRSVPNVDLFEDSIDLWLVPEDLPAKMAVLSRPRPTNRYWSFSVENILLLPMPHTHIKDLVETYEGEAVMGYHHLKWFLNNQEQMPEAWQKYKLYFLGFQFVRRQWLGHVYALAWSSKDGHWERSEEQFNSTPPGNNTGRIIMTR